MIARGLPPNKFAPLIQMMNDLDQAKTHEESSEMIRRIFDYLYESLPEHVPAFLDGVPSFAATEVKPGEKMKFYFETIVPAEVSASILRLVGVQSPPDSTVEDAE